MTTLTLTIDGMSCGHCLQAVNRSLTALDGVRLTSVAIGRAVLEFDPERITPERIVAAVTDAGYPASAV